MGLGKSIRKSLVLLITSLFIISSFVQMTNGYDEAGANRGLNEDSYENYFFNRCDEKQTYELSSYEKQIFSSHSDDVFKSEEITVSKQTYSASGYPMDSPWPMKCHDLHHTSRSPYSTADNPGDEKWRFKTDNWVEGGPVIDDNGTIYFGCCDRSLYALYPNGTLKWEYKTDSEITSTPALAEDGTLYVGSWDCKLYAINPNGTLKWKFSVGQVISSSPAIAEDGTIYFGVMGPGDKGRISAINPNGTIKWEYDTGYWIVSDPAIGDDGTVYIGSGDTYFYAMNPNGTLKWRFKTGDIIKAHPSIANGGTIYIGSFDNYLYALNPNGTLKWKRSDDGGSGGCSSAAIGEDGTIYYGTSKLNAVYPNGTLKWSFDMGTDRTIYHASPAISADGTIYVGTKIGETAGGEIIAVNPDGTEKWRSERIANEWVDSSPCIAEDGTVYVGVSTNEEVWPGSYDDIGYLYAFGELDPNAPNAPDIDGQESGKIEEEYQYTFTTTDPNGDDVYYWIEWGDNKVEDWIGPYHSGEKIIVNHTYEEKGTYTIRARAKDTDNLWGPWGEFEVTMPKNKQSTDRHFLQFLEEHPYMFPILRKSLGLE